VLSIRQPRDPRAQGLIDFPTLSVAYSLNPIHAAQDGGRSVTAG